MKKYFRTIVVLLVALALGFGFYYDSLHDAEHLELLSRKEADAIQHCVGMHGTVLMRYDYMASKFGLAGCNVPAPLER